MFDRCKRSNKYSKLDGEVSEVDVSAASTDGVFVPIKDQLRPALADDEKFQEFQRYSNNAPHVLDLLDAYKAIATYRELSPLDNVQSQANTIANKYLKSDSPRNIAHLLDLNVVDKIWDQITRPSGDVTSLLFVFDTMQSHIEYQLKTPFREFYIDQLKHQREADGSASQEPGPGWRNLIAFFLCGLINNFGYVIMLSAATDILKSSHEQNVPAAVVLMADILPTLFVKITAPFYIDKIHYSIRVGFTVVTSIGAFFLVAWGAEVWVRLIGVILASISSGFGEVTFLALTSFYHMNVVSAWSSGTGGAGIFGALFYLAFTTWFHLTPFVTLLVCMGFPVIMLVAYFFIMTARPERAPPAVEDMLDPTAEVVPLNHTPINQTEVKPSLSFVDRLHMILPLLGKYMLPLILVYFAEYLINQGIAPVLKFPGSLADGREYVYYQFLYQAGVFLSRSSVNIVQIRFLWIFPILQLANLAFLMFQATFHFIPSIWVIFGIIVFEGLMGGGCYVNVYYLLSEDKKGKSDAEASFAIVSMSDAFGISGASLAGFFTEKWLRTFPGNA